MTGTYTAIIKQTPKCWIGWIEEVSGVNAQAETREALIANLREALVDMLELNRADALEWAGTDYVEERIAL